VSKNKETVFPDYRDLKRTKRFADVSDQTFLQWDDNTN